MSLPDYHIRVLHSLAEVSASEWDALVEANHAPPFMRHAFLHALHECGCATPKTGWTPEIITLLDASSGQDILIGQHIIYKKTHSQGEYVFDYAWANAYAQHGQDYYPKLLSAIPFTPVPACKLLAINDAARAALMEAVLAHVKASKLSSWHWLFLTEPEVTLAQSHDMLLRHNVQFHWCNRTPNVYKDFDDFLTTLNAEKRKKIKQEERYVKEQGIRFETRHAQEITSEDWSFFTHCYSRTYYEHGNPPYLNEAFFQRVGKAMPENWLLMFALRDGERIAASLIALDPQRKVAYGRYWGMAMELDAQGRARGPQAPPHLHFSACYYQPLRWCIANGYARFEGGAQGEHKMARGLMPVLTTSAHWIGDGKFKAAIARHLVRENEAVKQYLNELEARSPLKSL